MHINNIIYSVLFLIFGFNLTPISGNKNSNETGTSSSYQVCADGLIVPAWKPQENLTSWDRTLRGFVYFFALLYLFLGVSIISDRFMSAIEVITSQEKEVSIKTKGEKKTVNVRVWNETVANLTLMALGSSAPEIMLSVIEVWAKNFNAGDLGPGTIVGSAAYNLFIIIAICVWVIPKGETRRIRQISVFFVTAFWSVFAYIWLYVILAVISSGVVEVWEGLLTFLFFPLTVLTAFIADKKIPIHKWPLKLFKYKSHIVSTVDIEMNKEEEDFEELLENARQQSANLLKDLKNEFPDKTMAELKEIAREKIEQSGPKSRAFYRIQATRNMTGGSFTQKPLKELQQQKEKELTPEVIDNNNYIRFEFPEHTVLENVGTYVVKVLVEGPPAAVPLMVDYQSEDGSANAGSDYMAVSGTLIFKPGQKEQLFKVKIIDDDVFEEDEHFFIHLSNPRTQNKLQPTTVLLGQPDTTKINILDDDHAGVFCFATDTVDVPESVGVFEVLVERKTGARGRVKLPYHTSDGSAIAGKDYIDAHGTLLFENNEPKKAIPLRIISENCYERNVNLTLTLGKPTLEISTNPLRTSFKGNISPTAEKVALEGMPCLGDISVLTINIRESLEFKDTVDMLVETKASPFIVGTTSWREQFCEAVRAKSDDEEGEVTCGDYCIHYLALFWKILFAFVPPTEYLHGWICFWVSIIWIGILTATIGDVAGAFGCSVGLADAVTAISLVALGTSLPDTFASKVAAVQDSTADNSVGNVTGSNAVNVFLGIGIAWSIAALYHASHGEQFLVPPGNLAFSVTLFCSEALIAVAIIVARRCEPIGGELGGPAVFKYITSCVFIFLWLFYVIMSTLEVYDVIEGF